MLRKMPARMAGAVPEVLRALVAKLGASDSSPLVTGLLCVLAQLVHANAQQLLDFLAAQPAPEGARSNPKNPGNKSKSPRLTYKKRGSC